MESCHCPFTRPQNRLSGNIRIGQIMLSTFSPGDIPAATTEITSIMRAAHKLGDNPDDFTVRNQTEIATAATATTSVMTGLLAAIASVSLLVGGIGIMNIMLVSVTERTREIGLRLSIGASDGNVLTQFLVESVVLSLAGSLIGIVAGVGLSYGVTQVLHWPTDVTVQSIAMSFGVAAATGVFFGFYPARKAAALDPIEALRYE